MRVFAKIYDELVEETAKEFENAGRARVSVERLVARLEGMKNPLGGLIAAFGERVGHGYDIGGAYVYRVLEQSNCLTPFSLAVLPGLYSEHDRSMYDLVTHKRKQNKMADTLNAMLKHNTLFARTLTQLGYTLCRETWVPGHVPRIYFELNGIKIDEEETPEEKRIAYVSHVLNGGVFMYGLLESQETVSLLENSLREKL